MIKCVVLGSGSKGNAIYFDVDGWKFLIDCGFTKIATKKRLATIGRQIEDITGVYITHQHKDHVAPWIVKEKIIYPIPGKHPIIAGFPLSHDEPCTGYTITDKDGHKVAIITDTGCIPEKAIAHLFDCSVLMVETSYSLDGLINSPYPTELQERIASPLGHLRDECAIELIKTVACPKLQYVVALHLSSTCINPTLIDFDLRHAVSDIPDCEVVITNQKTPTKMMVIM